MKKVIVLGISSLILWSCNNSTKESTTHQEAESHTTHQHDENSEVIELNNGEKWIVNEEMKPFVLKGSTIVNEYIQENKTDYKKLAEELKEQNNHLIKSCTMDGKSHDELHKWLHPHLELVKKLENETDVAMANKIVTELRHSYERYKQFFN